MKIETFDVGTIRELAENTVTAYLYQLWDAVELLKAEVVDRDSVAGLLAFDDAFFHLLRKSAKKIGAELSLDCVADNIGDGIPVGIRLNGEIISAWCRAEWETEHGIKAGRKPNEIYVTIETEKVEDRYKVTAFSEAKPCGADFCATVIGDNETDMILAVKDAVLTEAVVKGINPATIIFD